MTICIGRHRIKDAETDQRADKDILRSPYQGIGKPEPLRENLSGWWSRRIDETNRIVYYEQGEIVYIISCLGHYDD